MVMTCVVPKCSGSSGIKPNLRFHRFPKTTELCTIWAKAIHRSDWEPKLHSRICSDHFLESDYWGSRLRPDAIPSVFSWSKVESASDNGNVLCPEVVLSTVCDCTLAHDMPGTSSQPIEEPIVPITTVSNSVSDLTSPATSSQLIKQEEPENMQIEFVSCSVTNSISVGIQTDLDYDSPRTRKLKLKIKALQKCVNRREKQLKIVNNRLEHLRTQTISSENVPEILQRHFSGFMKDLVLQELNFNDVEKKGRRYADSIKQFAMTLHYYSPKAYEYVAEVMNLPNSRTIRSWLSSEDDSSSLLFKYLVRKSKRKARKL